MTEAITTANLGQMLPSLIAQLAEMQRRHDPRTGVYEALSLIMSKVGHIEKNRSGTGINYKFRGIDDVYSALQQLLAEHGVTPIPWVLSEKREDRQTSKGSWMLYTVLHMQYTLYHRDGSSVVASTVGEAADSGDKSSNKAMSAAQKYALLQIFCIPTEGDNDTENHSPEWAAPAQPQQRPAQNRAQKQQEPKPETKPEPKPEKLCKQCDKPTTGDLCSKDCVIAFKAAKESAEAGPKAGSASDAEAKTAQDGAATGATSSTANAGSEPKKGISKEQGAWLVAQGQSNGWTSIQIFQWCATAFKLNISTLGQEMTEGQLLGAAEHFKVAKPQG